MKQINPIAPPKHPLETKVQVELTLEEIALIRGLTASETTISAEDKTNKVLSNAEVKWANGGTDLPFKIYMDAGELLSNHGIYTK